MKNLATTLWLAFLVVVAVLIFAVVLGLALWLLPSRIVDTLTGSPFLAMGGAALILLAVRAFWKKAVAAHRAESYKIEES